mmetsp:Transcript_32758/g.104413  ORF Transcript_32758/g.104413 Transcript_32758/m.104413 type:complete len:178 (-) Transcript_32758:56-589(-)
MNEETTPTNDNQKKKRTRPTNPLRLSSFSSSFRPRKTNPDGKTHRPTDRPTACDARPAFPAQDPAPLLFAADCVFVVTRNATKEEKAASHRITPPVAWKQPTSSIDGSNNSSSPVCLSASGRSVGASAPSLPSFICRLSTDRSPTDRPSHRLVVQPIHHPRRTVPSPIASSALLAYL